MLQDEGYAFGGYNVPNTDFCRLRNGNAISSVELRLNLIEYYMSQGMGMGEAMAKCQSLLFTDKALAMVNRKEGRAVVL